MILKRLHLENFQSIRGPVTLDLAPLTLLYGPNSAGKSALGDAIALGGRFFSNATDATTIRKWWHHGQEKGRFVIGLGAEFPAKFNFGRLLDELGLHRLNTTRDSQIHEDTERPLWTASCLLDPSHNTAQRKIPEPDIKDRSYSSTEIDVVAEFEYPILQVLWHDLRPTRLSICVNSEPLVEILQCGATIRIHRRHSRFELARWLSHAAFELETEARELRESLPGEWQDTFVRISDEFIDLRYLLEPYDAIGLRESLAGDNEGSRIDQVSWVEPGAYETEDWEDPRYNLLYENLDSDQRACIESLRQVLCGIVVYPVRIMGAAAASMLRLGPTREVPEAHQLIWNSTAESPTQESWPVEPPYGDWSRGMAAWKATALNPFVRGPVNQWMSSGGLDLGYQLCVKDVLTELRSVSSWPFQDSDAASTWESVEPPVGFPGPGRTQVVAYLVDEKRASSVAFSDVGSGVAQVFPVLAAIALDHPVTFLEQPELHLHPRLQAMIGDFLISPARRESESSLLHGPRVVETHSEHLALRILRRVRETVPQPRDLASRLATEQAVAFYYLQPRGSETLIHRIRIDSAGRFVDRWPDGFFEDRLKDLFG